MDMLLADNITQRLDQQLLVEHSALTSRSAQLSEHQLDTAARPRDVDDLVLLRRPTLGRDLLKLISQCYERRLSLMRQQ